MKGYLEGKTLTIWTKEDDYLVIDAVFESGEK